MRYQLAVATCYLALMSMWVYGVIDRYESGVPLLLPVVAIIQVAVGFASGRWYASLLPLAAVLISVPAGYPPFDGGEPLPLWFGLSVALVVAIPLVVVGIVARKISEWRRAGRVAA